MDAEIKRMSQANTIGNSPSEYVPKGGKYTLTYQQLRIARQQEINAITLAKIEKTGILGGLKAVSRLPKEEPGVKDQEETPPPANNEPPAEESPEDTVENTDDLSKNFTAK